MMKYYLFLKAIDNSIMHPTGILVANGYQNDI